MAPLQLLGCSRARYIRDRSRRADSFQPGLFNETLGPSCVSSQLPWETARTVRLRLINRERGLARTGEDAFHVRSSNVCRLHRCYYVSLSRVCTPRLRRSILFFAGRSSSAFSAPSRCAHVVSSPTVRTWRARKARYDPAIISLDYGIIVDYLWPKVRLLPRYVSS